MNVDVDLATFRNVIEIMAGRLRSVVVGQDRRCCARSAPCQPVGSGTIDVVPELPEVEALAADLRERAIGREIDRADVAEFSVLKTYDPPLSALHGARISGTSRRGKFLDLACVPADGGPELHL